MWEVNPWHHCSLQRPKWNWSIYAWSSHKLLDVGKQKSTTYVEVGRSPSRKRRFLLMVSLTLYLFPKQDINSLIKSSKLFDNGDFFLNRGANQDNGVPVKPYPNASVGYRVGCISMTSHTWFKNPLNWDLIPSNSLTTNVDSNCCTCVVWIHHVVVIFP